MLRRSGAPTGARRRFKRDRREGDGVCGVNSGARPSGGGRASAVDWRRCWRWRCARAPWPRARRSTSRRRSTSSRTGRRWPSTRAATRSSRGPTTKDLAGAPDLVQYCVLPAGAHGVRALGQPRPPPTRPATSTASGCSTTAERWSSSPTCSAPRETTRRTTSPSRNGSRPTEGATWTLHNGGLSVRAASSAPTRARSSAVIVPGTGRARVTDGTPPAASTDLQRVPAGSPPECSMATCPAGFATLEPDTNPDQIGNRRASSPSRLGASPRGAGHLRHQLHQRPAGVPGAVQLRHRLRLRLGQPVRRQQLQHLPGPAGSAWKVPVTQADCNVENPAVGGGPSGFGDAGDQRRQRARPPTTASTRQR